MRLPGFLHAGLWRDEAFIYTAVAAPGFQQAFHRFSEMASAPPLFFVFMFVWTKLAGFSEIALRIPSFACSILTTLAVFQLGRLADRTRTGLLAAFLYAVSPLGIQSSDYVRPYPFLGLLFTLLAILFLQLQVAVTWRRAATAASLTLVAVFTHYFGALLVLILILFSFIGAGMKRGAATAAAFAVGAFPFIFWLPVLFAQMSGLPQTWTVASLMRSISGGTWETWSRPVPATIKAYIFSWSLIRWSPTGTWEVFVPFVIIAVMVLLFGPKRPKVVLLAGIFLAAVALEDALNFREIRYVYPFYPLFMVFAAWVLLTAGESMWKIAGLWSRSLVAACGLALMIATLRFGTAAAFEGAKTHSGIRTLVRAEAGDTGRFYVIAPDYLSATFFYYTRGQGTPFIGFARLHDSQYLIPAGYAATWNDPLVLQRAECAISDAGKRYRTFSYVADVFTGDSGQLPYSKTWKLLDFLKAHYALETQRSFSGIDESVFEYRFRFRPPAGRLPPAHC